MMDEQDYKSLILYYGREKFFHSMQSKCLEGLSKFPANPCFRLYNGFALVLGNRIQEGIRELNPIQSDKELGMAAILGLIYAHKRCTIVDKEALLTFDQRLKEERKQLTNQSSYYAGVFLFLSGKIEKAKEYAEKSLKLLRTSMDSLVLKSWCDLLLNTKHGTSVLDAFERALEHGKNFDAYLGQVRYHQQNNDFETAISGLNHLSIRYPESNVPLVEKMKTQLASWNWDHSKETAARILNLEPTNIEALRIKTLGLICHEGKHDIGLVNLKQLYSACAKVEPTNGDLHLSIAQLFSRVCGRNAETLECTMLFAEKAVQISPNNAEYVTELGYQSILLGRYKEAAKHFRSATKLDDSSLQALCGLTLCQMAESGASEQVSQQIEFLNEIQGTNKNPMLLYMSAKILDNAADRAIALLVEACEIHFKNLKTVSYGCEYLRRFDPDFLLELTNELLQYSPIQSTIVVGQVISKETLHISLKHSLNILEAVVKGCPGSVTAVYQLAKVEFLCGEIAASQATLQRILQDIDPSYSNAHLLIAQIHIQQEHFQRASQSLEICLGHNFEVRDNPMYHLLNGVIKKSQMQFEEALKCFQAAMNICNITKGSLSPIKTKSKDSLVTLTLADRVTLYLQMIDVYLLTNQQAEAVKLMDRAFEEFSNTPEEGRVIIASADIALQQGKIHKVLEYLQNIQPGQTYYLQAKNKLAYVYLHHKKDRVLFAQCFKELVDNLPGPESYLMLGDAYMSIQEPDEAINAFKMALRQNPSDPLLASKLGRAYVKTHQYNKAINYYKEAMLNDKNSSLKLDLAELFLKLKQFSNAEQILIEDIDANENITEDTTLLQTRTKQLLLLARIREKSGHLQSSMATLKAAKENQYRLQNRIIVEQSSNVHEQNAILARICVLMAEQSISLRDNHQAILHYKEALKYSQEDIKIMTSLARLYMQVNNIGECQVMCSMILKVDPNNENASVLMADLSFRRMNFESAAYHFSQLLTVQPTYWTALARLVEVLRRSAALEQAVPFLERAEKSCPLPNQEAGLNYAKGLYEWYNGNPNGALRFFNNSRRSSEWGQQSICAMLEICLNPDNDLPNENLTDLDDAEVRESKLMALRTAERLLKELKPSPGGLDNNALKYRLLVNFHNLATKTKYNVDMALTDFTNIAMQEEYKDHVGPILGLATAHILLKQSQRAKNQLKRVAKTPWNFEDAEYLERCWLILADIYIGQGKNDLAHDLLERVIAHNKSCAKAYELSAQLAEKENIYRIAASRYELAWKYGGKSKPAIGYKLAFNHMKNKKFAEAIDVCQQVLKLHPDYMAIKKDVLDKCRNNLRA